MAAFTIMIILLVQLLYMTESFIQAVLFRMFQSHTFRFVNMYYFKNESDFLSFARSGYSYDIEVKISRSDYLADFKKERHKLMSRAYAGHTHALIKGSTRNWQTRFSRRGRSGPIVWKREEPGLTNITIKPITKTANRFFFAVPEGMVSLEECPEYAGLIYVTEAGQATKVKEAPLLHKVIHDPTTQFHKMYSHYQSVLARDFGRILRR